MSDAAWNEVRKEAKGFQHAIGGLIKRADLLIPEVAEVDRPVVAAEETPDGKANFRLNFARGSGGSTGIDDLRIVAAKRIACAQAQGKSDGRAVHPRGA
jgi:hypothetical protein